jgi:lysophospholipase L1-like esterase
MRVLIFGASITQGFWDSKGGWANRLREYYDKKQLEDIEHNDEPTVFNMGVSGDTTKDVLARFKNETKARDRYGECAIVFSVGTNNAAEGEGRIQSSPKEYQEDLKDLVSQAKEFSDKIMFVGLPPCDETRTTPVFWNHGLRYTNKRIAEIDDAMRDFCEQTDIKYVRVRDRFAGHEKDLFADGLHPNDEGHELIYGAVRPVLDELLQNT